VNQKGSELPLEQAFAKMINSMENGLIKYVNIFFTDASLVMFGN